MAHNLYCEITCVKIKTIYQKMFSSLCIIQHYNVILENNNKEKM